MHVFVTGASGFIGSAVVAELIAADHEVTGMARSDHGADRLSEQGADVFRADLSDPQRVAEGAASADGVIHLAYDHGGSSDDPVAADRAIIEAVGNSLGGSGRPFVVTSGTLTLPSGRVGTESEPPDPKAPAGSRGENERVAMGFAERDVRVAVVRLAPCVHDRVKRGFVGGLIDAARRTGVSGYLGDGTQCWPAVHRHDAARLFRLALEHARPGTTVHGVGEEGVRLRAIADLIGTQLGVPVQPVGAEQASEQFGWLGGLVGIDAPASSEITQQLLDWSPTRAGLLDDLRTGDFFASDD